MKRRILVLLSTYNGEKYLENQLQSLIAQDGVDIHILVRDDGSTDNTCRILDEWKAKGLLDWYSGRNLGPGRSFFDLMMNCPNADYYAFCDQDDVWLADKLYRAADKLDLHQNENIPYLYVSNLMVVDANLQPIGLRFSHTQIDKKTILVQNFCTGCTFVFNNKLMQLFRERSRMVVDEHDYWVAMIAVYFGVVLYDDTPRILYRQHGNNVIGAKIDFLSNFKSKMRSFKKLHERLREKRAKMFLQHYGDMLNETDLSMLRIVAFYRTSFSNRCRFLFSSINMTTMLKTCFLKLRIILGGV